MKRDNQIAGVLALLAASSIWGASFVLAKVAFLELALSDVMFYRFLFAMLPFLPILLTRAARPRRRDLWLFALTGFLMVPVTFVLQFGGLMLTSATSTALLIGTGAPLLAVAGVLFEGERLGRRGWTAVGVSCVGVLFLVGAPGAGDDWRGNLMVLLSMVVATVWVILSKRLVGRYRALHATGWILLFGTLFLIPMSILWGGLPPLEMSGPTWASLLALGLGCTTLAYVLWNWGVGRIGAARAGVYLNFEPIVGALMGIVVMGDPLSAGIVAGGLLIVGAAALVSKPEEGTASPSRPRNELPGGPAEPRPSVHAEYAIRLYVGRPVATERDREPISGMEIREGDRCSDPLTRSALDTSQRQAPHWRPCPTQLAEATRVSSW